MRDVLDCGVLLAPGHESTMNEWIANHQGKLTRLRLHAVSLARQAGVSGAPGAARVTGSPGATNAAGAPDAAPPDSLGRQALSLRRYDGCILPVTPGSLAWARMALQEARGALTTPILLLIHDVKAPAILDLLSLGAADFIAQPACLESLRVRLVRLARRVALSPGTAGGVHDRHVNYLDAPSQAGGAASGPPGLRISDVGPDAQGTRATPVSHASHGTHASHPSHASHAAPARPRVPAELVEQALSSMRHQYRRGTQETFRAAKAQVVNGFEREYIRHALSRHGGNVAQAARACAKHRRAFWALMRKHGIEAAPYRAAAQAAARLHDDG